VGRTAKILLAALAGALVALPLAAAADGTGALSELQVVKGRALDGARGVAVSPDGKNVYVTGPGPAGGVAVFARDAGSGRLTQLQGAAGCVNATGRGGCAKALGVRGASSLAISQDGKSVYVVGFDFAVLSRNASTGALRSQGCFGAAAGCRQARGLFGGFVGSVAISPDGKNVYVGSHHVFGGVDQSHDDGAVAVFARSSNGALTQLAGAKGCTSNRGEGGCATASPLGTVGSLVVSPDGKNLYVGSETNSEDFPAPSALLGFKRAANGSITPAGCIARTTRPGCTVYEAIFTPTSLAVSADGKNVYATALQTHSVTSLARGSDGRLKPLGCVGFSFAGCKDNKNLFGPTSVALTADGKNAYVTWEGGGPSAVSAHARGDDGSLSFLPGKQACFGEAALASTCAVGKGLSGAVALVASPDGKNVYVASTRESVLAVFARS
jgi:DNA-binding beta-propeller fold protein YncE